MAISLVLEGGGMRGTYTTGVLDFLLDEQITFDACYGVSAGAGHACSFLSKQRGRAFRVIINNIHRPEYAGLKVLLKTGNYFNSEFIYYTVPSKLDFFDYNTFDNRRSAFYAVCTNLQSGNADYLKIDTFPKDMNKVVASASLPFLSKIQKIDGSLYLDGGIADSIPVKKSLNSSSDKAVVILTRDLNYSKAPFRLNAFAKLLYLKYPNFLEAMRTRHERYNETLEFLEKAEKDGKVFVFRPQKELKIGRLERNKQKLQMLYTQGFEDSLKRRDAFLEWLSY